MCIRDRVQVLILPAVLLGIALGNGLLVQGVEDAGAMEPVSYTHLDLQISI